MFSDLAKFMVELYFDSPIVFMKMAENMIAFLSDNHVLAFVFVVLLTLIAAKAIIGDDTLFDLIANIVRLSVIFVAINITINWWILGSSGVGEAFASGVVNAVNLDALNDNTTPEDTVCGLSPVEWQNTKDRMMDQVNRLDLESVSVTDVSGINAIDQLAESSDSLKILCNKVEQMVNTLSDALDFSYTPEGRADQIQALLESSGAFKAGSLFGSGSLDPAMLNTLYDAKKFTPRDLADWLIYSDKATGKAAETALNWLKGVNPDLAEYVKKAKAAQ